MKRATVVSPTLLLIALFVAGASMAVGTPSVEGSPLTDDSGFASARQWTPQKRGSDNIEVVSHLPLGAPLSIADIEIEQEMSRPYAYVAREIFGLEGEKGMDIIDLHDPSKPKVIYRWSIENQDLHTGAGGKDIKYF